MTLFHNNYKNSLTCDKDTEAVGDIRGKDVLSSSSYSLNPGLNRACVSSCITLLNVSNHDVSQCAGNKAQCCPTGIKQDTISSPWVGDVCSWVVGGIAGESEGHVQLSWDGGQWRRSDHGRSCVRRRGEREKTGRQERGEGRGEREEGRGERGEWNNSKHQLPTELYSHFSLSLSVFAGVSFDIYKQSQTHSWARAANFCWDYDSVKGSTIWLNENMFGGTWMVLAHEIKAPIVIKP